MAVVRWNPWNELFDLHSQMDQLFQTMSPESLRGGNGRAGYTHLPVDIRQTDDAFLVEASVPGLGPDDVQVTVDGGVLTIAGTSRSEREQSEGTYVRRERGTMSVFRQIGLPVDVRTDEIKASFVNGELTVTIPRSRKAEPVRIQVTTDGSSNRQDPQRIVEHESS
ncbi:MAG: Hsp20/alpha crystallin family protein [Candidatus Dormibacteria bacterium]